MQLDPLSLSLYCVFFLLFFVIGIHGKKEWRQRGMVTGFIVALFTEMWGFPLSIFVITSLSGSGGLPYQFDNLMYYFVRPRIAGDIAFTNMPISFWLEYTTARGIALLSILPIIYGWFHLKKNINTGLVTGGPYAYSRNPQYVGFILFTVGMVLYWPTLITIPMGCVLCFAYFKLALKEEKELKQTFKDTYPNYAEKVPRFAGKSLFKIFRLPRTLSLTEKAVVLAFLVPFVLWFAESVLAVFMGDTFVRTYWFPIAYILPIHIGVVISMVLLFSIGVVTVFKSYVKRRKNK
ncbi:MAG: isoprenylcysteine carboxylmethyltransferase family protein [Candidatus Bathyarchaeia archaeon]|jgi:protein-S-isoprenylcysteine O-methyltransferase Ste14